MRPSLPEDMLTSVELTRARSGRYVRLAGLVVARQRPSTAKGVTFMLLEDEFGTINLIVPPPIYDRFRLTIRSEPLITAEGRLERRSGTTNVVVDVVSRLERPDMPQAEVRHIEPRRVWSNDERGRFEPEEGDLRAVAPAAHSFGRRGR
jgi:error-prone DNA polymerase